MTLPEKLTAVLTSIVVSIAIVIAGFYWWAGIPPSRPSAMSSKAVFLWAPNVGVPTFKRGVWVDCRFDSEKNTDWCQVADVRGKLTYEGEFLSYKTGSPVRDTEVLIDQKTTNKNWPERGEWLANELVPLVYLQSGDVLIPKAAFEKGKKSLDTQREDQGP